MHLQDITEACFIIKSNFRKVLEKYREYKQKKELEDMFKLVNDFDKGDDYEKWL